MRVTNFLKRYKNQLNEKIVIVTGATGGLGSQTVKNLLYLGAEVVFCYRNIVLAKKMYEDIKQEFLGKKIILEELDLESFSSIDNFVDRINIRYPGGIDYLFNIAGVFNIPKKTTEDGHNNLFQINYLSAYYLTKKLLSALNKKANSRVVNTISLIYKESKIPNKDYENNGQTNIFKCYALSKRYLLMSTLNFADIYKEEYRNITFNAVHPGITQTNIIHYKNGGFSKGFYYISKFFMKIIFNSPKKASLNLLYPILKDIKNSKIIVAPKILEIWGKPKEYILKTDERFLLEKENAYQITENLLL